MSYFNNLISRTKKTNSGLTFSDHRLIKGQGVSSQHINHNRETKQNNINMRILSHYSTMSKNITINKLTTERDVEDQQLGSIIKTHASPCANQAVTTFSLSSEAFSEPQIPTTETRLKKLGVIEHIAFIFLNVFKNCYYELKCTCHHRRKCKTASDGM